MLYGPGWRAALQEQKEGVDEFLSLSALQELLPAVITKPTIDLDKSTDPQRWKDSP